MTAGVMIYAIVVGACIALAARAAETVARMLGVALRWIWIGALVAIVALTMTASVRSGSAPKDGDDDRSISMVEQVIAPTTVFVDAVNRRAPAVTNEVLLAGWAVASGALLLLLVAVNLRWHRQRGCWPEIEVMGTPLRVTPSYGPAVMGLVHPDIVVPGWFFRQAPAEQRMVIAHEAQHLVARDHLALTAAWLVAVAMPWNPAVWWILSRLRLAVELDCDARVLRAGTPAGPYGSLLIEIAALHAGVRTPAPALLEAPNHLHRRLLAMQTQSHRFASLRGAAAAGIAATALVVACRAELPTTAQVESMDAASALRLAHTGAPEDSVVFKLDGAIVSADSARRVAASQIRRVEVVRGVNLDGAKTPATIEMSTTDQAAPSPAASEEKVVEPPRIVMRDQSAGRVKVVSRPAGERIKEFDGLIFVDGKRADASALATLDRLSIKSVEVIKGASAKARYNDPAAEFGVILISTR